MNKHYCPPLSCVVSECNYVMLVTALSLLTIPTICPAQIQTFSPMTSFTTRVISGENVLVGAPGGEEGTAWHSNIYFIKEDTSDRTVVEYDMRGHAQTQSAIINFSLNNYDAPGFDTVSLYTFKGNGLANASDYFRIDNYISSFSDYGVAGNIWLPFSINLTSTYNQAIANGYDYLGVIFKNERQHFIRYQLRAEPILTVGVPEPNSFLLALISIPALIYLIKKQ